jgi:hypothetical protein
MELTDEFKKRIELARAGIALNCTSINGKPLLPDENNESIEMYLDAIENNYQAELTRLRDEVKEWNQSFDIYDAAQRDATNFFLENNPDYPDYPKLTLPDTRRMWEWYRDTINKLKLATDLGDTKIAELRDRVKELEGENEELRELLKTPVEIKRGHPRRITDSDYKKIADKNAKDRR